MDITGIGEAASAAQKILGMIFPDKTESEKNQLAAALALVTAQTDINKAEAQSSDPLEHWRGGMGWTCALAYFHNFVLAPVAAEAAQLFHAHLVLTPIDLGPLAALTMGMLGLGGLHVYQKVNQ